MVDFSFGGAGAAEEAARIQAQAAQAGATTQQQAFSQAGKQLQPFIGVGQAALAGQAALSGLGGLQAQQQAIGQIRDTPAQQFIRQRQERSLLRNAAALGGLGGGNVRSALQQQAAGFALQDVQNQRQQLAQLSGAGRQAATGLGVLGAQTAGNVAEQQQLEAAARATGILGAQQAKSSGLSDLAGVIGSIFG